MTYQRITFPLVNGVDQFSDPWLTVKLTSLDNLQWSKTGQLRKRNPVLSQPIKYLSVRNPATTGNVADASKLLAYKNEQILIDGKGQYLHSYSAQAQAWVQRDYLPEATMTRTGIFNGESTAFNADMFSMSGYTVYVWQTNLSTASNNVSILGSVFATVIDDATGVILFANQQIGTSTACASPHLLGAGGVLLCLYTDAGGNLFYASLDMTNPAAGWSAVSTLASDMRNLGGAPTQYSPAFDASVIDGTSTFVVAYESTNAAPNRIRVKKYTFALTLGAATSSVTINDAAETTVFAIGVQATTGERVYVAYAYPNTNGFVAVTSLNPTNLATLVGPTVVYTTTAAANNVPQAVCVARVSSSRAVVLFQPVDSRFEAVTIDSTLARVGDIVEAWGVVAISRPFVYNNEAYVYAWKPSKLQGTVYLVALWQGLSAASGTTLPPRPVCTGAVRLALTSSTGQRNISSMANVMSPTSTTFAAPGNFAIDGHSPGRAAVVRFLADFADAARNQGMEALDDLIISGGVPSIYDGNMCQEIGFLHYPEGVIGTPSNVGGSLSQGDYQYQIVYEFIDARGLRHRSAPSPAIAVTTTGAGTVNKVTLSIPPITLTNRFRSLNQYLSTVFIAIVVYRTKVGGTTFYRVTPDDLASAANSQYRNSVTPAGPTISVVDTSSDASIATNELLYTTGNVLPNFCPPSSRVAAVHKNRVWLAGTDDAKSLWYSKQLTQGIAPEFSDPLTLTFDEGVGSGGPITAIASMDDKLVVWKRDRIFIVYGDGPNDTGVGADYGIQKLAAEVGCIEPRSVVLTPMGLMFQSLRGIELLSRGLEVQFVGREIVDTLATYSTITGAVLLPDQYEVRFSAVTPPAPSIGLVMVYDYVRQQWGTFTYRLSAQKGPQSSTSWGGLYAFADASGVVYIESTAPSRDSATDGPHWITSSFETDWKKLTDLAGYRRVRRVQLVGNNVDPHDLTLSVATDYSTSYAQVASWAATDLQGMTLEELSVDVINPRSESLRIKVSDAAPTGVAASTYQGATFTGLALEVLAKPRMHPRPDAARR